MGVLLSQAVKYLSSASSIILCIVFRSLTFINISINSFINLVITISFFDEKYHLGIYKVGKK